MPAAQGYRPPGEQLGSLDELISVGDINPEVAVDVYLEHGVGATHAGPVARAILEAYFALPPEARAS